MRNPQVRKAQVFIASSKEALPIARAIQQNLEPNTEVTRWDHEVFKPTTYALESLLEAVKKVDFAILVLSPDDIIRMRGRQSRVARDNIIFELGLFIGSLGRDNIFMVAPSSSHSMRIPSDLHGLMFVTYDPDRQDLVAALGTACTSIQNRIEELWAKNSGKDDCSNSPLCSRTRLLDKISDDRTKQNLAAMYKLHKDIAEQNGFDVADDAPDALLIKYLVEYPMTRYVTALRDYYDEGMLYLRTGPRMSVAVQMISNSKENIYAVSVLSEDPWHLLGKSPFVDANMEAAERKVKIYRVYVVESDDPRNNLDAIAKQSKDAGITLRFQTKKELRRRLRAMGLDFPIVNILICDRKILTYSLEDSDHDGLLVVSQSKIKAYMEQFNFIWRASSDELPI